MSGITQSHPYFGQESQSVLGKLPQCAFDLSQITGVLSSDLVVSHSGRALSQQSLYPNTNCPEGFHVYSTSMDFLILDVAS